jgi:ParB-like chromosome segregation protein Spo0J
VIKLLSDWANAKREYELVSGFHRLEAKKRLGDTTIPCIIMEGDERLARMWEISENLHRAEVTPFEHDEQVAEWVQLLKADPAFYGQNVQKKGRGRPEGGISEAARRLPIKGETHAAKRKNVERALKVASIFPKAKDAAKKAGFDKNRAKLLQVAAEKTLEAQLAKIRELTAHESKTRERWGSLGTKRKTTKAASKTPLSAEDQKILEQLLKVWNDAGPNVRDRFIAEIRGDLSPGLARSTRSQWA